MGRGLIGSLILTLYITYSSASHRYHHHKPRDLYDEYSYSAAKQHSAEEEDPVAYEIDEPNVHEELNAPEPVYDVPNFETADENEIPDNARANAPNNGYEVTEDVDDIPNPVEFRPIVANYSRPRPLNLASTNNTNENSFNRESVDNNNKRAVPNNVHTHEDLYSFSDIFPDVKESFEGVKESFGSIKDSFVHDLNSIKDKVIKKVNKPMDFLNKLHRKASDVINNINEWFGYKHNDEEDFETF